MHYNHFVAQSNINNQPNPQISSILDRLQQLKRSMRPQVNTESDYESNNLNFGQNSKHAQRLNQYLPKENQQRQRHNQQGIEDYQSYRKSLEKKLNSLFQKQKQIFKVQSNFHPVKTNDQIYSHNQYTNYNDLQRKYDQFKKQQSEARHKIYSNPVDSRQMKSFSNLNTEPKALQTQSFDHKQYRVQSTIQSNYHAQFQYHNFNKNEAEIDQMQRKIKLLELKYLGTNLQNQNIHDANNHVPKKLDIIKESILKRQNKSRSTKSKYRKQRTQPQKSRKKCNTYHKQTIDYQDQQPRMTKKTMLNNNYLETSNKKQKFDGTEINQNKVPLKDYMKTLDHNVYVQSHSQRNPTQSQVLLHKQFYELKQQFEQLLAINRSIVEKVQINEEQRMKKREKKQRAKAMLKQILIRLDQIKLQIKSKPQSTTENINKEKTYHPKIKNAQKQYSVPLDIQRKEENNKNPKKHENKDQQQKIIQESNHIDQNEQRKTSKSREKEELNKLKQLLDLQIKHRHLVQKKLELVWNKEVMID